MILLHVDTDGLGIGVLIVHLISIALTFLLISIYYRKKVKTKILRKTLLFFRITIIFPILLLVFSLLVGSILLAYLTEMEPLRFILMYVIIYAILIIILKRKSQAENKSL
jgi:hypothetical protein